MAKTEHKPGTMHLIGLKENLRPRSWARIGTVDCENIRHPMNLSAAEASSDVGCSSFQFGRRLPAGLAGILLCAATAIGATNMTNTVSLTTNAPASLTAQPAPPETSRGLYNAGTAKLAEGKLDEAERLLQSSLARQDERIQPHALYNLGYTRFAQGKAELKKELSSNAAAVRSRALDRAADGAIQQAETALEGTDLRKLVAAYLNGRGVRRELAAATKAVQQALEAHGETLRKWRRSVGDFKSAEELDPADTNALRNAEVVEQAIARLVDSMQRMQQMAMDASAKSFRLNELMKQLRGRIPKDMMPPGAPGDEEMDALMEAMRGLKEAPSQTGDEMELRLSPEEAGQLLDGIRLNGNRPLPTDQFQSGQPHDRSGRTW